MKLLFTYLGIDFYFGNHNPKQTDFLFQNEYWKGVKDYESLYQISTLGRVKALRRWSYNRYIEPHFLKTRMEAGYLTCSLFANNKNKRFFIHRLICFAFLPNPMNKPKVNHKDGIKHNNLLCNLEWCTQGENVIHYYELKKRGIKRYTNPVVVKKGGKKKKFDNKAIIDIRLSTKTYSQLARDYSCNHQLIRRIKLGKIYKHVS